MHLTIIAGTEGTFGYNSRHFVKILLLKDSLQITCFQWRIQDFPEGVANSQSGIILQTFCRKLHENERIWTRGGGHASLAPPLDPPMALNVFIIKARLHVSSPSPSPLP